MAMLPESLVTPPERTIYTRRSTDAHLGPAGLGNARDFGAAARRCSGVDAEIDLGPKGAPS